MVARSRDVVTGSKSTRLNAVELVPYDRSPVTSRQVEPSQYCSFQPSGSATPSPVPLLESRQNFSSAPVNRIGRGPSYWIHCVAARSPDQVPQICACAGLAGSASSLSAVTLFQPAVYEAVAVAIGPTLPFSGADRSAGMVTDFAVSTLPALSVARNETLCLPASGAATGSV